MSSFNRFTPLEFLVMILKLLKIVDSNTELHPVSFYVRFQLFRVKNKIT